MDRLVKCRRGRKLARRRVPLSATPGLMTPVVGFAQAAGSPFETRANSLVTFAQTIGTPIAALVVIGLAWPGR